MDKFEQHLQRQPLNGPPADWRTDILEVARQSRTGILPVTERIAENELAQELNATVAVENEGPTREGRSGDQTLKPGWLHRVTGRMPVLRDLLWPHPGAWASLAAIWLFLFVMQHQMNVEIQEEITLAGIQPPVTDVMVAMEQHQIAIEQLLAMNNFEPPVIDRPRRMIVSPTNLPPLMILKS